MGEENLTEDFDSAVDQYHTAAGEFIKGNPEPYKRVFSRQEDVSVANPFAPFGPLSRGPHQVHETFERASSQYKDGEVRSFENLARLVTPDLAYIVEVERYAVKIAGSTDVSSVALRTTSILRPEEGTWKVVHRQADPITTPQPMESVIGR
jgi:ketosteroid isomerase-like protein